MECGFKNHYYGIPIRNPHTEEIIENLESIFLSHHPSGKTLHITKFVGVCVCVCARARIKSVVELDLKFDVRER